MEAFAAFKEDMKAGQESVKDEIKAVKEEMIVGQEEIKRKNTSIIENKFEVAEANGCDSQAKACHLAASLRAEAADILQTLPENKRLDFEALSGALELHFGEKCLKDYSKLQLKSRQQKPTETLQELATDVESLS
ncbi:hypothetical protein X975_05386, partial [Stegodyphus mimosarum]